MEHEVLVRGDLFGVVKQERGEVEFAAASERVEKARAERDGPGEQLQAERTLVEMAVACDLDDEDAVESLSNAFDRGLGYVREAQRAYYLARRRPIRLAARESKPFGVPFAVRRLRDDDGDALPFRVSPSLYLLNSNLHGQTRDADLDTTELERLSTAFWQQSRPGFLTDYLEFVRETQVALDLDGSYRTAALWVPVPSQPPRERSGPACCGTSAQGTACHGPWRSAPVRSAMPTPPGSLMGRTATD